MRVELALGGAPELAHTRLRLTVSRLGLGCNRRLAGLAVVLVIAVSLVTGTKKPPAGGARRLRSGTFRERP